MDWVAALIIFLLTATLIAFFHGVFTYPYGWLILIALLIARLTALKNKKLN